MKDSLSLRYAVVAALVAFVVAVVVLRVNRCFHFFSQGIDKLEGNMQIFLDEVESQLPDVYDKAKFKKEDIFIIIQGLTGFLKAGAKSDPFEFIDTSVALAKHYASKCNLGQLKTLLDNVRKWMKFGKEYKALQDSSDLDFDKVDIGSIPELMKVIWRRALYRAFKMTKLCGPAQGSCTTFLDLAITLPLANHKIVGVLISPVDFDDSDGPVIACNS